MLELKKLRKWNLLGCGIMLHGSKRKEDMKAEQELGRFLDDYFYNRLKEEHPTVCYERQYTKQTQMDGIDVVVQTDETPIMYIDEKVSIYYRNTMLPTFAFEINSIQKDLGER